MSNVKSNAVLGPEPQPSPVGSEVVNILLALEAATGNLTAGDLLIMGEIPEDCVMVDAVYAADDLDSAAAILLDFGTINAGETDLDTTIEAGLTVAQAAATAARLTHTVANLAILGGNSGVNVGFKVATIPTGAQAGSVLCSLSYRSVHHET